MIEAFLGRDTRYEGIFLTAVKVPLDMRVQIFRRKSGGYCSKSITELRLLMGIYPKPLATLEL